MHFTRFLLLSFALGLSLSVARGYEPPSPADLDALLANPNLIADTLDDADGEQAADLMLAIIGRLQEARLNEKQRQYMLAYYAARITYLLGEEQAKAFATSLLSRMDRALIPPVLAGMSTGGRGSKGLIDHLRGLAGEDEVLLNAINNPSLPLTPPVYNYLLANLGAAQSLPPVVTDSLPPPIPVGETEGSTPPPVGERYAGQGGAAGAAQGGGSK